MLICGKSALTAASYESEITQIIYECKDRKFSLILKNMFLDYFFYRESVPGITITESLIVSLEFHYLAAFSS